MYLADQHSPTYALTYDFTLYAAKADGNDSFTDIKK
jgi:hypothetical protein